MNLCDSEKGGLWSVYADAQADLSNYSAHTVEGRFLAITCLEKAALVYCLE